MCIRDSLTGFSKFSSRSYSQRIKFLHILLYRRNEKDAISCPKFKSDVSELLFDFFWGYDIINNDILDSYAIQNKQIKQWYKSCT